jgi:hypothetical protein
MYFYINWARFKSLVDTKSWTIYYKAHGSSSYSLWTGNNNHQLRTTPEGSDKTTFENDYKSEATSVTCEGDALSRIITF